MNLKRALLILLTAAIILPGIALAQDVPPPVTTRFLVEKAFTDSNPGEVKVTLTCNTGLPLTQSAMISFDDPVAFVVEEMIIVDVGDEGATTCEITEDTNTSGYDAHYEANDADSPVSCLFVAGDNLLPDANFCDILNVPQPVAVSVTKDWEISGAVSDEVDTDLTIYVQSHGEIIEGHPCYEEAEYSCLYLHYDGSGTQTFHVVPAYDGVVVSLYEDIYDSSVESSNTCGNGYEGMEGWVTVYPNQGASCTFTNTVFFEGIPTLSQYGLAIMALLMLGVGFVGFRRFV